MRNLLWAVYEVDEFGDFIIPRLISHPHEFKRYQINKLFHVMRYSKLHNGVVLSISASVDARTEIPKILNYCLAPHPSDPDPLVINWTGIILGESASPQPLHLMH